MVTKGFSWNEEYKKNYYASEKVQENLKSFIEKAKQPKSDETKQKMSIAKSGRKYSEEHKANMAETHRFRNVLRKDIQAAEPNLPKDLVWEKVREKMNND